MSCNFEFRVEKRSKSRFIPPQSMCFMYFGEIKDSFIENIIVRRQEILENRHFNHPIQFVLENAICFFNLTQWKTMRNKRSGVNLPSFN